MLLKHHVSAAGCAIRLSDGRIPEIKYPIIPVFIIYSQVEKYFFITEIHTVRTTITDTVKNLPATGYSLLFYNMKCSKTSKPVDTNVKASGRPQIYQLIV